MGFSAPNRFSTRLVLGALALIVLTTLSAGVPAYWLTRTQLEQQAWAGVRNAQQATRSLLLTEQERLADLTLLLAERPTLQRLARQRDVDQLAPYLANFQGQSGLDLLLLCDGQDASLTPAANLRCADTAVGFVMADGRPALLTRRPVVDNGAGELLGTAVAGLWLDDAFLRRLAADTGVAQNVLSTSGVRLAGSLPQAAGTTAAGTTAVGIDWQDAVIELAERPYFAAYTPLSNPDGRMALVLETAVPVETLLATEIRAQWVLVASTGLVALLGALLGVWMVRQLLLPLQQLTAVAEQISAGDLVSPIPNFTTPVEVSTLAAAMQRSQASMLRALEERSQARDWLDALIQSVAEGVITLDDAGRVTFFSQGAETMTGWRSNEAIGRHVNELLPLVDEAPQVTFSDRLPPPGQKRQIAVQPRRGGSTVLAVTGAALAPPDGNTVQTALVLRDVTQEEALRQLRAYFLANISHEFQTPLSTLNASMELLLDEQENLSAREMRELLQPSYISLLSLQTLINNLLESSSIEAGRFVVRKRPLDLNQFITDAVKIVQPLLLRRRQALSLSEPGRLPPVLGDATRLTQALVNLLANASKYSPIGQPVDLHVARRGDMLRITISDRGPGIPDAEREHLFRRFVRLAAGDPEQYGIGLGLYVVKTVVEAHGGAVGVDNRPRGGAAFWFELPLAEEND